ncbi:RrF2 family transcriptional regulator [Hyphococcus luteus]|uniref:BadM/Rrf2 family transcriptional regulator n=1 Tax=Hyphococcus luteus TaxID=2058213 RepID=A0A2S7KB51_9PROT|nr:Rrf2 family transcriptional regulator [Marinicaulis flavus]PQA89697.1 BadM/Rrf2 family transcriptional regulator [Marinicaulis flavus]
MRLTVYSDYALRLLMYVAINSERLCTIQEIADHYNISKNHLMKVTYELGLAGYIETVRGRSGGIRLARASRDIGIGDVIRSTEEDFKLVECFDRSTNQCMISGRCKLARILDEALGAYMQTLDKYTLADLASERGLKKLLAVS